MPQAVIIDCLRTPVGKAPRGALRTVRPDDLASAAIKALLAKFPQLDPRAVDDVILGCAMPEAEQGMNLARVAALAAGLPVEVPAMTINRFCSSGLQAIALAAEKIAAGSAEIVIAGGAESMSMVPVSGTKFAPNPRLAVQWPEIYISMGLTAENLQRRYAISREDQDAFALRSHQNALAAQSSGAFDEELIPIGVERTLIVDGKPVTERFTFAKDEGPRADTSLEALAKLKPVFHAKGTVTAGNASQTSDGAAAALVMSETKARELGLTPKARFLSFAVAGCAPEVMGLGPVYAIPKALRLAGLALGDIGLIELNEAFAVQALAVIREAGLNIDILNVNGGAVALGHPLGCTGAKLTATLLNEMRRRNTRYGMVTMCIGGGQGAAGIFELVTNPRTADTTAANPRTGDPRAAEPTAANPRTGDPRAAGTPAASPHPTAPSAADTPAASPRPTAPRAAGAPAASPHPTAPSAADTPAASPRPSAPRASEFPAASPRTGDPRAAGPTASNQQARDPRGSSTAAKE
jgi:acetyl-CoA acyltransferase